MIDTLTPGGAERMAVNLANLLPPTRYRSYLCSTRAEGSLAELVETRVGRLRLARRRTLELGPLRLLLQFITSQRIQILHAHSNALLLAALASCFPPYPRVVWHVHFGQYADQQPAARRFRLLCRRVSGVLTVTRPLAEWASQEFGLPGERVRYLPNFVAPSPRAGVPRTLPGCPGKRLVCLANLRAEKDHLTLVRALAEVVQHEPEAHLLIAGAFSQPDYHARLVQEISRLNLTAAVTLLGEERESPSLLHACDIGVLSSRTEGLPLSLLEYGAAGLPAVATSVGEYCLALAHGQAGLLVAPANPAQLAAALLQLLRSPEQRLALGQRLQQRVTAQYSAQAALDGLSQMYETVLSAA
jgi:glycosyltransferase involved in cell wall biosynthesis